MLSMHLPLRCNHVLLAYGGDARGQPGIAAMSKKSSFPRRGEPTRFVPAEAGTYAEYVEMRPSGVNTSEFDIVNLTVKRGLLNDEDLKLASFLVSPLMALKAAVTPPEGTNDVQLGDD